jgi:hypothetical protein
VIGPSKRFGLALVTLLMSCLLAPQAMAWSFGEWELGLAVEYAPASGEAYTTPATTFVDAWGDDYTLTAQQAAVKASPGLGFELRTPGLVKIGEARMRLRAYGSVIGNQPDVDTDSWSYLGVTNIGPVFEMPFKSGSIEAGVYYALGSTEFSVCKMPSAWYGDPGFGTSGGDFIKPGTDIRAKAEASGISFSAGAKFPLKGNWVLRIQAMTTTGVKLSDYTYTAGGEFGGGAKFALPQLQPIDLSGTTVSAGVSYAW